MYTAKLEQINQERAENNKKLSDEILAVNQTELQRKLSLIEHEKQEWIKKGADVAKAEELAQKRIAQANQETEKKLNEIRDSVASADRSELENKLAAIDKEKSAWIEAGMEIAEAEELAQRKRQKVIEETNEAIENAQQKYADAVAKANDDAAKKTEASFEEAARKNEALRNEALNTLKQEAEEFAVFLKDGYAGLQKLMYGKLIKSGVNPEQLKQMTPEALAAYQDAKKKATKSFLPNWEDPYSGKVYKPQQPEMPEILEKSLTGTATAADNVTESLNRLAGTMDGTYTNTTEPEAAFGDVAAYRQDDGSILIQNAYDGVKSNLEEQAIALGDAKQRVQEFGEQLNNTATQVSEIPTTDSSEQPSAVQSAEEAFSCRRVFNLQQKHSVSCLQAFNLQQKHSVSYLRAFNLQQRHSASYLRAFNLQQRHSASCRRLYKVR